MRAMELRNPTSVLAHIGMVVELVNQQRSLLPQRVKLCLHLRITALHCSARALQTELALTANMASISEMEPKLVHVKPDRLCQKSRLCQTPPERTAPEQGLAVVLIHPPFFIC